jgi:pimeloyl-ACP methyl ester carboxylesterase
MPKRAAVDGAAGRVPPLKELAGGRLFGAYYGESPPRIVGLHGWGRSHKDFDFALDGLPALAVDLPGFGASPRPPAPWGTAEYADSLKDCLEELGGRFVFVGHSFGGRVAMRLAQRYPSMVGSLVLTGTPLVRLHKGPKISFRYRVAKRLASLGVISDARLESFRRRYGSSDYRSADGVMRDVLVKVVNEDYSDVFETVSCDVHLIWGADDRVVPPEVAERAAELFPSSRLTILEGHDHYSVLDAHEFKEAIQKAEAQLDLPSAGA